MDGHPALSLHSITKQRLHEGWCNVDLITIFRLLGIVMCNASTMSVYCKTYMRTCNAIYIYMYKQPFTGYIYVPLLVRTHTHTHTHIGTHIITMLHERHGVSNHNVCYKLIHVNSKEDLQVPHLVIHSGVIHQPVTGGWSGLIPHRSQVNIWPVDSPTKDYLFNRFSRKKMIKTTRLRITGLLWGGS